jgi:hypothetical protein
MRGFLGDVISTDPQSQNLVYSFLRRASLNCAKGLAFFPWALIRASSRARFSAFGSTKPAHLDPSGVASPLTI